MSEKMVTPAFAIEEASRCLLCHDAPCTKACPVGTDPAKFIRSLRFRNLKGAAETIRENNVLAGICARVCPTAKYCESACSRCGIDKKIEIAKIQRYLTDYEHSLGLEILKPVELTKEKVAIIGSGPSGLGAATKLAQLGYNVTVFEAREKLGGWLTYGIPEDRLPQSVVDNEIAYIDKLGVKFKTCCNIGKDISIDELKKQGFKAILVSIGMQEGKKIDVKGADLDGVLNGVQYLSKAKNSIEDGKLSDNVVVIGGGDVAIDCATTAKLMGSKKVCVVYRRNIEDMPAERDSINYLINLNIPIFTGFKPEEIIGEGKVQRFIATGMKDDSKLELKAQNVIFAIGQDSNINDGLKEVEIDDKGTIKTLNHMTNIDGVFASGDITDGDKTVVYALNDGKMAALDIHSYLSNLEAAKEGAK